MEAFAPRRILAVTDFSDLSTWALRHAVLWAQRYGAQLTVLHAYEVILPWPSDDLSAGDLDTINAGIRKEAEQRLAAAVREHVPPDLPVSRELALGPPAKEIERYAQTAGVDLVVLSTHGREGIERLLMGSVAEQTLRRARCPTLLVRPPAVGIEVSSSPPRLEQILCPVNDTEVARAALAVAGSVARAFSARLSALSVTEPGPESSAPERLKQAEEQLRSWLPAEAMARCEVQVMVRHGDPAAQVIDLAREAAADLIVIGAQHRLFADTTVLGVTTVRVTRHAPCPVLVVPRPAP